ncbi:hypothetical protein EYZ11_006929 [Aspergillus tanneri]|uniref:Uncharacterized protein n=1 Tax=Aspergillus tanneri TaxID=1220188 RepID=A0A4S3JE74_9EURO|nr:hypothetical protein EYZ11_006929 [Aspergillus tanneri]
MDTKKQMNTDVAIRLHVHS